MTVYRPIRPRLNIPNFFQIFLTKLIFKLSIRDRIILVVLFSALLIASGMLLREQLLTNPFKNKTFIEGIIASSPADVEPTVQALTHIGLLTSDNKGNLTGQLAESWSVSDDAKSYEFKIKPNVDRRAVLDAYNPAATDSLFAGAIVEPVNDRGIKITLNESFSPFLTTFTRPLIPLGPYIVKSRSKEEVKLVSRPDYYLGESKIESVTLKIFPTLNELNRVLAKELVDGVSLVSDQIKIPSDYKSYSLTLPRKTAAFFNLDKPTLKDKNFRQKLYERSKFDRNISLNIVTTDTLAASDEVQKIINDWKTSGVTVILTALPAARIQTEKIPNRDYDVLIFGIDLGAEPDPYLFWHSSQRKSNGLNLANFANVDADKLLESIRKTGRADQRNEQLKKFEEILNREIPWVVIDDSPIKFAIKNSMKGPSSHGAFYPTDRFSNIEKWEWRRDRD